MDTGNDQEHDQEIAFVNESSSSEGTELRGGNLVVKGDTCVTPQPPSRTNRSPHWSAYDPYSPTAADRSNPTRTTTTARSVSSLLDGAAREVVEEEESSEQEEWSPQQAMTLTQQQRLDTFLEMEDEDSSQPMMENIPLARKSSPTASSSTTALGAAAAVPTPPQPPYHHHQENYYHHQQHQQHNEPIMTSSGLLLTHRKPTPAPRTPRLKANEHYMSPLPRNLHREGFEVEGPSYRNYHHHHHHAQNNNNFWNIWRRRMSLIWVWLALSAVIFVLGTAILWHHVSTVDQMSSISLQQTVGVAPEQEEGAYSNRIILLPMDMEAMEQQQEDQQLFIYASDHQDPNMLHPQPPLDPSGGHRHRRRLSEWQEAFAAWAQKHGKTYTSDEEREYRLRVWMENHHRTAAKNAQHGPCPVTQRPVFGNSNHLQDLTREEFQSQYLNAQRKPRKLQSVHNQGTLGPHIPTSRHADVHHRIVQQQDRNGPTRTTKTYNCKWYDVSCNLRWIIDTYFYGYFGIGRTMEPAYDADSYPNAVDWRGVGAVTAVRSQGDCGACWAITAVETLESAIFLSTGKLYTLSETEIILCNEKCQMCAGGWPEEAFEYIMENNGVPLRNDLGYDGSYLLKITNVLAGESDELYVSDITAYQAKVCPANGSNDQKSGSQDKQDAYNSYNSDTASFNFDRYGGILAGYGYATDPCLCYTNGSGCSCNSQDENMAVRNVATYGPAVVCVDASDWQDYAGGILTSASGCSAEYLDVNHCVQVVGYAFADNGQNGGDDRESGSGDRDDEHNSHDRNLGSSDKNGASYEGYWIVRNQWSEYWGMNGYAYVAMGENTCGILNDMLQVYTD